MEKMGVRKIVLVDDNEIDLFVSEAVLRNSGFNGSLLKFNGGEKALDYLLSLEEETLEGILLLLDINMPLVSGLQILDELKKHFGENSSLKVAMLTSSLDEGDREQAGSFPFVIDFIQKPLSDGSVKGVLSENFSPVA